MKTTKINFKALPNYEAASKITICFWNFPGSRTWRVVAVPEHCDNVDVRRLLAAFSYQKGGIYYLNSKNAAYVAELLSDLDVVPLMADCNKRHLMN